MTSWHDKFPIDEVNDKRINIYLKDLENEDVEGLKEIITSLKSGLLLGFMKS